MKWLSRGLFEALIGFIGLAEDHRFALRAALYEFHYQPVANAFAKAVQAGADVKIVYDAESSYKVGNNATIANAGLDQMGAVIPRTVTEGIRHNKFIVLLERQQADRGVDRLDQHLRWRHLRPFERRPHRLGQGRARSLSRLLGAACGQT